MSLPICPVCNNNRFIHNGRWCGGRCATCQEPDYPSGWRVKPAYREQEPKKVRLTDIFFDPPTGMGYPKGTILYRLPGSSQYGVEGTKLGQECIAGYFLIKDICEPVTD